MCLSSPGHRCQEAAPGGSHRGEGSRQEPPAGWSCSVRPGGSSLGGQPHSAGSPFALGVWWRWSQMTPIKTCEGRTPVAQVEGKSEGLPGRAQAPGPGPAPGSAGRALGAAPFPPLLPCPVWTDLAPESPKLHPQCRAPVALHWEASVEEETEADVMLFSALGPPEMPASPGGQPENMQTSTYVQMLPRGTGS